MSEVRARLRAIEVLPIEHEGQRALVLRDPEQLVPVALTVSPAILPLLRCLDGEHSVRDMQAAFLRATGSLIDSEQIEGVLAQLDEALLLDSDHYRTERARIEAEFRAAPVRDAAHAGAAYPAEPEAYRTEMDGALAAVDGAAASSPPSAVISPHIDYSRGLATYAHAWAGIEPGRYRRAVVLGTSHYGDAPFAVTDKDHATPFGRLPADRGFLEALERRHGGDLRASELLHRREHSIELNAAMLHHLAGGDGIPLVPILCGSFHEHVGAGRSPGDDPAVRGLLDALRDTLAASPGETLLVAAADLAHVGPRFGDPTEFDAAALAVVERDDRASLEAAAAGDAEGFYRSVAADGDRRKVCGMPPIYAMLSLLDGVRGALLDYRQCPDPVPGSFVSIAAMRFGVEQSA